VVHDDRFDTSLLVPPAQALVAPQGELVRVPVRYDGDDLAPVAAAIGATIDEVIAMHTAAEYSCAFCGFMPGFSYLVGLDPRLHLARRSTPRTRVPAGAVAIASEFTAVYPGVSPGGWHLLGATTMVMWDESLEPAATLPPGTRVRFEAT
jgi:KipI family sensor histidine kinase inhibitor